MSSVRRITPARIAGDVVLAAVVVMIVLPLALALINAFKPHIEIMADPLALPTSLDVDNFVSAWFGGKFATGIKNSILLSATSVLVTLTLASMAAFALARERPGGWQLITLYFLGAITVPIQLFMFPLFFIVAKMGLVGNVFATGVILSAVSLPLATLLLRTFVLAIPAELDDAAFMDGANKWQTFVHIILPLLRPGLITVAFIVGLHAWNEFLITSTFQQDQDGFTVMLGYRSINSVVLQDRGLLMAGGVIVILPVIIFFLALQKFFIQGLTAGAVKG